MGKWALRGPQARRAPPISSRRSLDIGSKTLGPPRRPRLLPAYVLGGRAASEAAIERARAAGYAALVVTIDTPVAGLRERDYRNGIKELLSGSLWTPCRSFPPCSPGRPGSPGSGATAA